MSTSTSQVGLRLTGDVSDLQGKLQQGGQSVSQFGRQAQQDLGKVEMSAKQTAFALRGLPAQFTDIVVSLQSGQRPLTVLMQQGGQIKDMFGGIGPAARAMGGYIAGLVNPYTLAAGAVGLLTYAYMQGSKEQENYTKALILSGNVAGTTTGQLADMARELGKGSTTQHKAAETLAAMAQSGAIASDELKRFAGVAIAWEKSTGQAVDKTIDQFKELEKAPLDASVKLNGEIHHLTLSVYEQIKALEDHGQKTAAAKVAMNAYADVMDRRDKQIVENNGYLETSWNAVAGAAAKAWDAMRGIGRGVIGLGRDQTGSEQLASLKLQLASRLEHGPLNDTVSTETWEKGNKVLRDQIALIERLTAVADARAKAEGEEAKKTELRDAWRKKAEADAPTAQRRKLELDKAEGEGRDLVNKGVITEIELRTRLNNIKQKYNETTGQGEVASIRAQAEAAEETLLRLRLGGQYADKVLDATKLRTKLENELTGSLMGQARVEKQKALDQAKRLEIAQLGIQSQEKLIKGQEVYDKLVADSLNLTAGIRQQALEQEAANGAFGKSKTAIEQLRLAQINQNLATAQMLMDGPEVIADLAERSRQQERLVKGLQEAEYLQSNRRLDEEARAAQEETATLQLEVSLLGMTREERDKIVAVRRVEVKLAQELAEIDKLNLGGGDRADREREALKEKARANAQVEAANASNKVVLDEWTRTADQINQSLTDALLRGFESGKDAAQNFRDTLKNMFQTLVLRPMIQGVVSGAMYGSGQSGAGGPGAMGYVNGASSLYNLGSAGSSLYTVGSQYAAGTMSGTNALGTVYGNATGSGIEGLLAANGGYASSAGAATTTFGVVDSTVGTGAAVAGGAEAGAAGAGAASGLAAIPVYGWIALAALAAYEMMKGGETRVGGQYSGTNLIDSPSGGPIDDAATKTAIATTIGQTNALLAALGSSAAVNVFQSGLEQSDSGMGFAYARGTITGTGASFGNWADEGYMQHRGTMTAQEAAAAFGDELKRATLEALQAADVPGKLGEWLKSMGDIEGLSGGTLDAALARLSKALGEKQQLEDRYYELSHTDAENLARTRERERASLDESNRALYDQITALMDQKAATEAATAATEASTRAQRDAAQARDSLTGAANAVRSALKGVAANVAGFADEARQAAAKVGTARQDISNALFAAQDAQVAAQQRMNDLVRENIRTIDEFLSGLSASRTQSLASLKAQLSATSVLAAGGDSAALARLIPQAQALLKVAEETSSSRADLARQEAFARQQLEYVKAAGVSYLTGQHGVSATAQGSLEQAQADLAEAASRVNALVMLAVETGSSTDRSMRDAANSITGLSAAYYRALSESTRAQDNYSTAVLATAGLQLATAGTFDALNESLVGLDSATTAAGVTLGETAGLLTGDFVALRAALAGLLTTIGAHGPAVGTTSPVSNQEIRDYIGSASPNGGTAAEIRNIYDAAIQHDVSSSRIDDAMHYAPGTALRIALENGLPAFEDGTNSVPRTGLALLHQYEMVVPAKFNPALLSRGSDNANLLPEMLAEMRAMRAAVDRLLTSAYDTAKFSGDTLFTLQKLSYGGNALNVKQVST